MNRADPSKTVLFAGFFVSAFVHISIWGIASGFIKIGRESSRRPAEATPQAHAQPKPEPRIHLGIDQSKAYTLTWLGYSEATEHAGDVSTVEQSAMTPSPGSVSAPVPAPPTPAPRLSQPAAPSVVLQSNQLQESAQALVGVGKRLNQAIRSAAKSEVVPPTPPSPPSPSQPKQTTAASPSQSGTPGLPSDKESVASAVRKAPKVVLGQVLASEGLDIQTKSPKWGITTMQTRRPANPTVQITFGSDGKVVRAGFVTDGLRSYATGFDDVDEPLLSAIYTWTARGKHLAELTSKDPNGEVTILITIILNG